MTVSWPADTKLFVRGTTATRVLGNGRHVPGRAGLALTPFRGHLVREDVHHGTYTSGVHS